VLEGNSKRTNLVPISGIQVTSWYVCDNLSQHNEKPGRPQWKMEYATPSSKVTQVFGC